MFVQLLYHEQELPFTEDRFRNALFEILLREGVCGLSAARSGSGSVHSRYGTSAHWLLKQNSQSV
jgi:hypothetical protein